SLSVHRFGQDVCSPSASQRLRWIMRKGGYGAIYGLIRRNALLRTRLLSKIRNVPKPGLSPDYLVYELSMLGAFAPVPEPLLKCRIRPLDPLDDLAKKLSPECAFLGSFFFWMLNDFRRIATRYRLGSGIASMYCLRC